MTTPLWTDKLSILYEKKYLFEIVPNKQFDFNRKLNSLLRLSIYYSIIIYLLDRSKTNMFYIPFVVGIATYVLSHRYKETFQNRSTVALMNDTDEEGDNKEIINDAGCRVPTEDNPFGNPGFFDGGTDNYNEEPCLSYNNKGIQYQIDKAFLKDLPRGVDDIFRKNNSDRQFYTVPGTTIPHDNNLSFAKWLYSTPKTCKEGNGLQCAANVYGVSKGPMGD